jgi:hypothetical protein
MNDSTAEPKTNLPDADRLSVLAAMIMLAYVVAYFSRFPATDLKILVLGVMLSIPINLNTIVALLVAGMTAAGANWLFHDHPGLQGRSTLPYWLLPALTALVGGVPLSQAPNTLIWWVGLGLGGVIVVLVLIGEYISIDAEDVRLPLAAAGLTALSFALYLVLATTLRSSGTRLSLLLPSLTLAAGLVSLRVLNLRLNGQWLIYEAGLVALLVGQGVAALYYWPLSSLRFGVLVLGLSYALVSLFINLIEEKPHRQVIFNTFVILVLAVGAALWLG